MKVLNYALPPPLTQTGKSTKGSSRYGGLRLGGGGGLPWERRKSSIQNVCCLYPSSAALRARNLLLSLKQVGKVAVPMFGHVSAVTKVVFLPFSSIFAERQMG